MKNTFFVILALMLCALSGYGQGTKLGERLTTALRDKQITLVSDVKTENTNNETGSKSWYKYRKVHIVINDAGAKSRFENAVKAGYNEDRANNNLVIMANSESQGAPKVRYDVKYAEDKSVILGNDSTKSLTMVFVEGNDEARHVAAVESKDISGMLDGVVYIIEYKPNKDGLLPSEQLVNHLELSNPDSDIIKRLRFFRDKYKQNPTSQAPISAVEIAVNAICQNPNDDVSKAQDIVLNMMEMATEAKHIEMLEKMNKDLTDAMVKSSATGKRIIGPSPDKLVLIDGKESSFDQIDRTKIRKMEIIDGDMSEKYGPKAKNGVIRISSKK